MSEEVTLYELKLQGCSEESLITEDMSGSRAEKQPEGFDKAGEAAGINLLSADSAAFSLILEQLSKLDEATFPANIWGLESYRKSAENDYDYLAAACFAGKGEPDEANAVMLRLAGFALLRCFDDAELIRIAVAKEYRRQGIGSKLLRDLIDETRRRDIHTIFLEVRSSNAPAIGLYEGAGFERVGVRKNYYSAPQEDALIMRYTW